MANEKQLIVRANWDDEALVWVATSEDIPGLATEASTVDRLLKKLLVLVPELLELNGHHKGEEIPFEVCTHVKARSLTYRRAA